MNKTANIQLEGEGKTFKFDKTRIIKSVFGLSLINSK
jgi:hypothetical protein